MNYLKNVKKIFFLLKFVIKSHPKFIELIFVELDINFR